MNPKRQGGRGLSGKGSATGEPRERSGSDEVERGAALNASNGGRRVEGEGRRDSRGVDAGQTRSKRDPRSPNVSSGGASTSSSPQARNELLAAADNAAQRQSATPEGSDAVATAETQQREQQQHRRERSLGLQRQRHGKGVATYREAMVLQPSAARRIIVDSAARIAKSYSSQLGASLSSRSSSSSASSLSGKQSFATSPLPLSFNHKQPSEQKLINNNNNTSNNQVRFASRQQQYSSSSRLSSSKTASSAAGKLSKMADQAVIDKLEAGFAKLQASTPEQCHSLLKKYLTRDVLDKLKSRKTAMGATLLDVAQSGFENLDSGVGIYAPDAESYTLFAELFNPIIEDYHGGFKATDKHPASDFGDLESLVNVDPEGQFVISTRVRCGRSLKGYPFNPCLTEAQYKEMESKVSSTLKEMDGDLAGTYYPLTGMTKETQQQLIDDHFLFKEGDRFLQAANACRYWPTGRGIYHNDAKTFLVWVNEEDHLRIISMQKGGDLKTVFGRLVRGARAIEAKVPFSRDERLGFLTFCPTNLGTTIRASVHIKLPKLAADRKKLEEVAARYNLQVRGTSGEHTESIGGIYDISNKRRLGLTEYQAVKEMQDGILELIKIEKSL